MTVPPTLPAAAPAVPEPPAPKLAGISACFPAYNDAGTIPSMVLTALLTLRDCAEQYEVVVVNDGSADHTGELLAELARLYAPLVRVVTHPANRGYGAALRSAFAAARLEWIFYTDGDAQYDARELRALVAAAAAAERAGPPCDVVNGYKRQRQDPWYRVVIGRCYHHVVKLLFGFRLRDVDCDFRLIRRRLFDAVTLRSVSGSICLEMVKKFQDAGFRFLEVPVNHYPRAAGRSQFFNFRRVWRTGVQVLELWYELVWRPRRAGSRPPPAPAAAAGVGTPRSAPPEPTTSVS